MKSLKIVCTFGVAYLFLAMFLLQVPALQAAELVRVKNKDGKESQLYQKLVTVLATTPVKTAPSESAKVKKYIGAYNIFFHGKTDSGKEEQNGFYRIADRKGKPLGWIEKKNLQVWGTRFAIEPERIDASNTFTVDVSQKDGGGQAIYNPRGLPPNAVVYSLILEESESQDEGAEDEGPFPVAFLIARQDDQGVSDNLNELIELTLEIVFVIEMTDFMLSKYDGSRSLKSYIDDAAAKFVAEAKKNKGTDGDIPVRLGLVVYQDTNTDAKLKRPEIVQPLTDDLDAWLQAVQGFTPTQIVGDMPEDGLSGVDLALKESAGWRQNSSKHVVLIGKAAFQEFGRKQGGAILREHFLSFRDDRQSPTFQKDDVWDSLFGYNSCGKSLSQIRNEATNTGGSNVSRLQQKKNLHAINAGLTFKEQFTVLGKTPWTEEKYDEFKSAIDKYVATLRAQFSDDEIEDYYFKSSTKQSHKKLMSFSYTMQAMPKWDAKAKNQYTQLAGYRSLGEAQSGGSAEGRGFFGIIKPSKASVEKTTRSLREQILTAIEAIGKVATGNSDSLDTEGRGNSFTQPIMDIVGSSQSKDDLIEKPVRVGTAFTRSTDSGRLVGEKVIMVSMEELNLLKGQFNQLFQQFNAKKARAERQNVTDILDDLKKNLAVASSGQDIDENTKLSKLITDLPLRTEALEFTAGDIAVMPNRDFEAWLEDLQLAEDRASDLLSGDSSKWVEINSLDKSDLKYGFFSLSQLP